MPREIKTTIAVDGEAAFKRAINDANTSIRNMSTQLTLAQAQFRRDGDAMKLAETRSKALRGEIGQQEEIVKALEKAVEDSTKAYGENSQKTEKWEAELNRARARLVNMQNELTLNEAGLDRNGKAFEETTQKAADYQATLQGIGKNVSFEAVTSGISGITSGIEGALKKLGGLIKSIREAFVDAGTWADDLLTDAVKYDMDVEELQKWQNAADFIDTDVETIISARDKLGKKMKDGWKDEGLDMWQVLGVDLTDAEGNYRDKMDVMWEVGETLMNMARIDGDDVRADNYAMQVFGKSWRELMPLFTAGREEWEKTVASQRVVSKERVQALGELDDANQALENSWDVTKYSFLAELAPVITDVTNAVTKMLDAFNEWMDTDEGKQAMQELSDAIRSLFSGLTDLKFADVIDGVKDAINGIKDAFVWIDEHKDDIVNALKVIAIGFAGLELAKAGLFVGQTVNGLRTLFHGKTTAGAPAANAAPAASAAPAAGQATATQAGSGLMSGHAVASAGSGAGGTVFGSVPGLSAMAGEAGMGGALGGAGSLSMMGMLGGLAVIAAGTYGLSELVNSVNDRARNMRMVQKDLNRYENFGNDYTFSGVSRKDVLETYANALMGTTGDTKGAAGPEAILRNLATGLGSDLLSVFNYKNTSGEQRNKLIDMLDMDTQSAAIAAMMLHAAGVSTQDVDYSAAYQDFLDLKSRGALGFSSVVGKGGTLTDFFENSMEYRNGRLVATGSGAGGQEIMPVINGQPLANMSGYVMSLPGSTYNWGGQKGRVGLEGTWDPSAHVIAQAIQDTMYNTQAGKQGHNEGLSKKEIDEFVKASGGILTSVEKGTREGVSNLKVLIDGYAAGRILAPFISQEQGKAAQ